MKLRDFITESKKLPFIDIITPILRDCKPFIKEAILPQKSKINFLYSGRGGSHTYFDKKKARKGRVSKDTHPAIHNDLNREFQKQHGYPARSNSIFTTGDINIAGEYGYVYCVFPIGRYKYLWNPNINDLYVYFNEQYMGYGSINKSFAGDKNPLITKLASDYNDPQTIRDEFEKYYDSMFGEDSGNGRWEYNDDKYGIHFKIPKGQDPNQYVKSKLPKGAKLDFQNLDWIPKTTFSDFRLEEYDKFADKMGDESYDKVRDSYDEIITDIVSGYRSDRIVNAIKSDTEIMLNCDEYYIMSVLYQPMFRDWIKKFGGKIPKDIPLEYTRKIPF